MLRLTVSVPRLLIMWVFPVCVSLGVSVGILGVCLIQRSGCPRGLRVVGLLSVCVILFVQVVMFRNVSVAGISVPAGDGGGR